MDESQKSVKSTESGVNKVATHASEGCDSDEEGKEPFVAYAASTPGRELREMAPRKPAGDPTRVRPWRGALRVRLEELAPSAGPRVFTRLGA